MIRRVVHKFGGSCLRSAEDLERIEARVRTEPIEPLVVVSALWGVTDRLVRAAGDGRYAHRIVRDLRSQHLRFCPTIPSGPFAGIFNAVLSGLEANLLQRSHLPKDQSIHNAILASGERLSAIVVAQHLMEAGHAAHPVGSEDIGVLLDGRHRAHAVDLAGTMASINHEALHGVPVITGWFGQGSDGSLALLDRGGSDHTAAALGSILDVERVILWKDVDGVRSLNPRWGGAGRRVQYLGYAEAEELALFGGSVLHPQTLAPVRDRGVRLDVRWIDGTVDSEGTTIGPEVEAGLIFPKAIGCLPGVIEMAVRGQASGTEQFSRLLHRASVRTIPILSAELDSTSARIRLPAAYADTLLDEAIALGLSRIQADEPSTILSLIGAGIDEQATAILEAVGEALVGIGSIELLQTTPVALRCTLRTETLRQALIAVADATDLVIPA